MGIGSSRIRLLKAGGYRIEREAALDAASMRRAIARSVLFVCTGNTCRSPMAEIIASELLGARATEPGIEPGSAGVAAALGAPPSQEIFPAIAAAGFPEASAHSTVRSKPITREMIEHAEAIYRSAEPGIPRLPRRCRAAIFAARLIYADIGRVIAARSFDSVSGRAMTSLPRKLWLLLRALVSPIRRDGLDRPALREVDFLLADVRGT